MEQFKLEVLDKLKSASFHRFKFMTGAIPLKDMMTSKIDAFLQMYRNREKI
jgi:hypothetical protein